MSKSTYSVFTLRGGSGSSASGIFVGQVANGGSFPTSRLDGSPLQTEDYVLPKAPFPFTIGGITFNSERDKAFYTPSGWVLSPGAVQDTAETSVADKTTESLSGTKVTQQQVNKEFVEEIKKKENKVYYQETEPTTAVETDLWIKTSDTDTYSTDTYVFDFASELATWDIVHNLDAYPSVSCVSATGEVMLGEVTYPNSNEIIVKWSTPQKGKAYLN